MTQPHQQPGSRNFVEHAQDRQHLTARSLRMQRIREGIEACAKGIARGGTDGYYAAAELLRDEVVPTLEAHVSKPFSRYGDEMEDRPGWHWPALKAFLDDPDAILAALGPGRSGASYSNLVAGGALDTRQQAKTTVQRAVSSMAAIAEAEEIVDEELKSRVDAVGFQTKIGEHLQDAQMNFGDPVRVVTEQSGSLKTLFSGGTGQGKSASGETEFADYFNINAGTGGREMKLIDPAGLRDGENWFYDIPQQDEDLRRIREEMGLPPSFDENPDAPERDIEILLPLTRGLPDKQLPYDTDDESFTTQPFTVPASEISDLFLVKLLSTRLTDKETYIIWDALDEVKHQGGDWALKDLANEIRQRDDLSAAKKQPPVRTLKHLQNVGFIRTKDCEHTLDWEDLFTDTGTITVFSQSLMEDEIGRLTVFGYIIESIVEKRKQLSDAPECAMFMRELWKVVPHRRRQSFDPRASELQEAIGHRFTQLFRENRHFGIHVLGDTQYIRDLMKAVRELFNRYVLFNVNRDAVEDVFEWTGNDRSESFYNTITPQKGIASVVGQVEPAIKRKATEFVGPIQYAPPPHHHRIAKEDSNGWKARCKYLDHEELRRPRAVDGVEWSDSVPTYLKIADEDSESDATDAVTNPVAAFAENCVTTNTSQSLQRKRLYTAFNAWAHEHPDLKDMVRDFDEAGVAQSFATKLRDALGVDSLGTTTKDYENAYPNMKLTAEGEKYYQSAMEGFEDAAAPIRAD
jgi:hypothetical protein